MQRAGTNEYTNTVYHGGTEYTEEHREYNLRINAREYRLVKCEGKLFVNTIYFAAMMWIRNLVFVVLAQVALLLAGTGCKECHVCEHSSPYYYCAQNGVMVNQPTFSTDTVALAQLDSACVRQGASFEWKQGTSIAEEEFCAGAQKTTEREAARLKCEGDGGVWNP